MRPLPLRWQIVEIGNAHGRIALYLDERDAFDIANSLDPRDTFHTELLDAVAKAYPTEPEEDTNVLPSTER